MILMHENLCPRARDTKRISLQNTSYIYSSNVDDMVKIFNFLFNLVQFQESRPFSPPR